MCQMPVQGHINVSPLSQTQQENPAVNSTKPKWKNLTLLWLILIIIFFILMSAAVAIILEEIYKEDLSITSPKENEFIDYVSTYVVPTLTDIPSEECNGTGFHVITRREWGALPAKRVKLLPKPTKYVVVCHTGGRFCKTTANCSMIVQYIQQSHLDLPTATDTPYNFLVGDDGYVYEGRGWNNQNEIMEGSITIAFIGNYLYDHLTPNMIEKTKNLTKFGMEIGALDENYHLIGHNQTKNTVSPGRHAYDEIVNWSHYSAELIV